jgi:hypothetical protein
MIHHQVRRRRRRRFIVPAVVLVVILAVIFAVTRVQSDRQLRREYLNRALEVAESEQDVAGRLGELVAGLENMDRPAMVGILDELRAVTGALFDDLTATATVPGDLRSGQLYLGIAVARWQEGMVATRTALMALSEAPEDEAGLALLSRGLIDLRVGDSAYGGFLGVIQGDPSLDLARPFPDFRFVPASAEQQYQAADLARRVSLIPGLAAVENLTVVDVRLDPGPAGEEMGIPVVPVSDRLNADVTIANHGTVESAGGVVLLELVSQDGTKYEDQQVIGALQPGELTSVQYTDLPVQPGKLYEIIATIEVEDDNPSDDTFSFTFIRDTES